MRSVRTSAASAGFVCIAELTKASRSLLAQMRVIRCAISNYYYLVILR